MNTVTVTLGALVDKVLVDVQDPSTTPLHVVTATSLTSGAVTMTVTDAAAVNISDVLEIDSELLLVTGKNTDPIPVLTVARGYYGSVAASHSSASLAYVNPRHPRVRVAEAVKRCFTRLEGLGLPMIESDTFNREAGYQYVEMPSKVRDVLRVGYVHPTSGRWFDVGAWAFIDSVPTSLAASGKILRLSRFPADDDDLIVTFQVPYRWSTFPTAPTETSTITLLEGTEDLPAVYAVAWLSARREVARQDIARAEEWNQGEPSRGGVSGSTVRVQWQEFYRALDEAKRLFRTLPVSRPYVPAPRI